MQTSIPPPPVLEVCSLQVGVQLGNCFVTVLSSFLAQDLGRGSMKLAALDR